MHDARKLDALLGRRTVLGVAAVLGGDYGVKSVDVSTDVPAIVVYLASLTSAP